MANTCTDCGSTLSADGTCPNCEENGPPSSKPTPAFGGKKAPPFGGKGAAAAPAAAPAPPAQKWMNAFKK